MSELPSGDEPKTVQLSRVTVFGELTDSFRTVASTRSSPLFLMGAQDGRHVLVPFIELNLMEQDANDEGEQPLISVILTFENIAYVLESLGADFLVNCLALSEVAGGSLKPPADRVTFSLEKLRGAQASFAKCVALLEALEPTLEKPAPPPPRARRRVKL